MMDMLYRLTESPDVVLEFMNRHPTFSVETERPLVLSASIGTGEILKIGQDPRSGRWKWGVYEPVLITSIELGDGDFASPEAALENFTRVSGLVRPMRYEVPAPVYMVPVPMDIHGNPEVPKDPPKVENPDDGKDSPTEEGYRQRSRKAYRHPMLNKRSQNDILSSLRESSDSLRYATEVLYQTDFGDIEMENSVAELLTDIVLELNGVHDRLRERTS